MATINFRFWELPLSQGQGKTDFDRFVERAYKGDKTPTPDLIRVIKLHRETEERRRER